MLQRLPIIPPPEGKNNSFLGKNEIANQFLLKENYELAIQLFLQTRLHELDLINRKILLDKIQRKEYEEALYFLNQFNLVSLQQHHRKKLFKQSLKKPHLLPPDIGLAYALAKHFQQMEQYQKAKKYYSIAYQDLLNTGAYSQDIPIAQQRIDELFFDIETQTEEVKLIPFELELNTENLSINKPRIACNEQGEIVAILELKANNELYIKIYDCNSTLHFTENDQTKSYTKIHIENFGNKIELSGVLNRHVNTISTNASELILNATYSGDHLEIDAPQSHLIVENEAYFEVENHLKVSCRTGNVRGRMYSGVAAARHSDNMPYVRSQIDTGTTTWHFDKMEVEPQGQIISTQKLEMGGNSLTNDGGLICSFDTLAMKVKEDLICKGTGVLVSHDIAIAANKMKLEENAHLHGVRTYIKSTDSFKTDKNTHIDGVPFKDHTQIITLSLKKEQSIEEKNQFLAELSEKNNFAPILIRQSTSDNLLDRLILPDEHNFKYYLYQVKEDGEYEFKPIELLPKQMTLPPGSTNKGGSDTSSLSEQEKQPNPFIKMKFQEEPRVLQLDKLPFSAAKRLKDFDIPKRSKFTLVTNEAELSGKIKTDNIELWTSELTNVQSSSISGTESVDIYSDLYANTGTVESNNEGGSIEIRVKGPCLNGLSNLEDLKKLPESVEQLKNRATHRAHQIKVVAPLIVEVGTNRIATHYKSTSIANFHLLTGDYIRHKNESQIYAFKMAELPNFTELYKDIKGYYQSIFSGASNLFLLAVNDKTDIEKAIIEEAKNKKTPLLIQEQASGKYYIYGDKEGDENWDFSEITSGLDELQQLPFGFNKLDILKRTDEKFTQSLIDTLIEGHPQLGGILSAVKSSISGVKEKITATNVISVAQAIVRNLFPHIGGITTIVSSIFKLAGNIKNIFDQLYKLSEKWEEGIDLCDILEALEPIITSIAPAIVTLNQLQDTVNHGVVHQVQEMRHKVDETDKFDAKIMEHCGGNIEVARSLVKDEELAHLLFKMADTTLNVRSALSFATTLLSLFGPTSSNNSIGENQFLSTEISGSIINYSVISSTLNHFIAAINVNDMSYVQRDAHIECAVNSAHTGHDVNLLQNIYFAFNLYVDAANLKIDKTTLIHSLFLWLKTPSIPLKDFLSQKGIFENVNARNKSANLAVPIKIDEPVKQSGEVSLATSDKEGITVEKKMNAGAISLNATEGSVQVNADLDAKGNINVDGEQGVYFKGKKHQESSEQFTGCYESATGKPIMQTTQKTIHDRIHVTSEEGSVQLTSGADLKSQDTDFSAKKNNQAHAKGNLDMKGLQNEVDKKTDPLGPLFSSHTEEAKPVTLEAGEKNQLTTDQGDLNLSNVDANAPQNFFHGGKDNILENSNVNGKEVSNVIADRNVELKHATMNSDHTKVVAGEDATLLASNVHGNKSAHVEAKRDLHNKVEEKLKPNPNGGTVAEYHDSSVTSEGDVLCEAGRHADSNGTIAGKQSTVLKGDQGVTAAASTHPYVAERSEESSWCGLVHKERIRNSTQVYQPVIGSAGAQNFIQSAHARVDLHGVILPGTTQTEGDKGVFTEPVIINESTEESTDFLGGWLYHSESSESTQHDIPVELQSDETSHFISHEGGIHLRSINMWGEGGVVLNAPNQQIELSAPILTHQKKTYKRGFGVEIRSPVISAVDTLVNDAKQMMDSRTAPEVLVNTATVGVDAVNEAAAVRKSVEQLRSANIAAEGLSAIPVYAHVTLSEETTDMKEQFRGQGACFLHRFEAHGDELKISNGYQVSVQEAVLDTKKTELSGAELKSSIEQQHNELSIDVSVNGVTGGGVAANQTKTDATHHAPATFTTENLQIHSDELLLQNALLHAKTVSGNVGSIEITSAPDTVEQKTVDANVSNNGAGISCSSLDSSITQRSEFLATNASQLNVAHIHTQGGTFKAPDATVGEIKDTPVIDYVNQQGFNINVNFSALTGKPSEEPITIPLRGSFQESTQVTKQDANGTQMLEDSRVGFNFVIPTAVQQEATPLPIPPPVEQETSNHPVEYSIPDAELDPLNYDAEAELSAVLKSFQVPSDSPKETNQSNTEQSDSLPEASNHPFDYLLSFLPISIAYAETKESDKNKINNRDITNVWIPSGPFLKKSLGEFPEPEALYRGSILDFDNVFNYGFTAPGTNADLRFHAMPPDAWYLEDSAFVATSLSKEVAAKFPYFTDPETLYTYLYEIHTNKPTLNVEAELSHRVGIDIPVDEFKFVEHEQERAFLNQIDPWDIKGGWKIAIKDWPSFSRTIQEPFIPNPNYFITQSTNLWNLGRYVGHGLTLFSAGVDARNLYGQYCASEMSGNYSNTYQEAARITGAWTGAWASGKLWGRIGMKTCAPLGPYASVACGVTAGFAGSIAGYYAGGKVATHVYENGVTDSLLPLLPFSIAYADTDNATNTYEDTSQNDHSLIDTTGKETFLKMIKSFSGEVPSIRFLGKAVKADLYADLADQALSSEDKYTSRIEKSAEIVANYIATVKCAGRSFAFFRSIPAVSASPISYLALLPIFYGSSKVCGRPAEQAVKMGFDNINGVLGNTASEQAVKRAFDEIDDIHNEIAYERTMMNF